MNILTTSGPMALIKAIARSRLAWLILIVAPVAGGAQTAKDDVTDAGREAKQAAKDAGKATKKTAKKTARKVKKSTKRAVNKSADKVEEGADKVRKKTE